MRHSALCCLTLSIERGVRRRAALYGQAPQLRNFTATAPIRTLRGCRDLDVKKALSR